MKNLKIGITILFIGLTTLAQAQERQSKEKIEAIKTIVNESVSRKATKETIKEYTQKAFKTLKKMNIPEEKKQILYVFGEKLMNRNV